MFSELTLVFTDIKIEEDKQEKYALENRELPTEKFAYKQEENWNLLVTVTRGLFYISALPEKSTNMF